MSQNWRNEVNAADHFLHQKKRVELEARRPVIKRASDLVGPGIGASAVRITNFNDLLATYNGYYGSAPGAANAPEATDSYVGITVMDDILGGTQVFTGMVSGNEFKRIFRRNPSDPSSVSFTAWEEVGAPPTSPFVPEQAYDEKTNNFTSTNTSMYSTAAASTITGLSLAGVVGEGKPVDIIFSGIVNHSVANPLCACWINSDGQNLNAPGGAIAFIGMGAALNNRSVYLSRRFVLVEDQTYAFSVGVYASLAGTHTWVGAAQYPMSLRVNRLA